MPQMPVFKEETVSIGPATVAYVRGGSGPSVLCLHGLLGSQAYWLPTLRYLAKRFDVVGMNLLGHGGSDSADGVYSAQRHVEAIGGLLDKLGWGSASIVAHSMGGSLALTLSLMHPERVQRLVISATPFSPRGIRWTLRGMTHPWLAPICFGLNQAALRVVSLAVSTFSGSMSAVAKEAISAALTVKRAAACQAVQSLARMQAEGFYQGLARFDAPTLLLYGAKDDVVPPSHGEQFLHLMPNARLQVLEGAGHVPMIDQFEAFVTAISDFLSEGLAPANGSGADLHSGDRVTV